MGLNTADWQIACSASTVQGLLTRKAYQQWTLSYENSWHTSYSMQRARDSGGQSRPCCTVSFLSHRNEVINCQGQSLALFERTAEIIPTACEDL